MRYWLMAAVAAVLFAGSFAARSLLAPSPGTAAGAGSATPARIVSLSPGITESLYAVGAGGQVVGVTTYCNWPPEARALPRVGAFLDTNFEAIVGLAPDLVVLMPSHRDHRAELERLGLRTEVVDQTLLEDIPASLELLGRLTGHEAEGRSAAETLRGQIARVREKVRGAARPRVLLSAGRDLAAKSLSEVYIAGHRTFLGQLLDAAGAENAFPDSAVDYPALSGEAILRLDPDRILEVVMSDTDIAPEDAAAAWRGLEGLRAAREDRILVLQGAHLTIPGPRVGAALEELARAVHPELDWAAP